MRHVTAPIDGPARAAEGDDAADSRQGIQSVEIASRVLVALEQAGGPVALNELAKRCGAAPNKIHRYLVSLGRAGLTAQSQTTGRYDLGPTMRRIGAEALRRSNEVAVATDHVVQLSNETGHAVNLSVWSDAGPVVVRWDYGSHALSLTARIGAALPLLESAAGQVFLAHLPSVMTSTVLDRQYGTLSAKQLADIDKLKTQVRRRGYAEGKGGVIASQLSYAVLVASASEPMPLVATVVLPKDGFDEAEAQKTLSALIQTAAAITADLGGPPHEH
ncbi:IclR family transcriptional regulator [Amycolatopsis sp. H20-H5]|nr:IclR family transcriptional regulator [Amycolatopsis sp. H20-H5]